MARFTLTRVNNQLRDMQPGSMLADWAPPPMEEEEEAAVDRSSVAVSSAQSGYGGEKVSAASAVTPSPLPPTP